MERDKKHKKVVRQRILAFIITIIVLAGLTTGAVTGIKYLIDSGLIARMMPEKKEPVTVEATEEPSEADSWIAVEREKIVDDYADVDTSVLSENETEDEPSEVIVESDEEIESIIENLDTEEKIAQLFMVTPEEITGVDIATRAGDSTKDALTLYPVGGLIYFSRNFEDTDQTVEMLSKSSEYIRDACGIAPFIGVDEEGGKVVRVADNEAFVPKEEEEAKNKDNNASEKKDKKEAEETEGDTSSASSNSIPEIKNVGPMADIGKAGDMDGAYNAGAAIGAYLSAIGFNLDFAPDADVLSDEGNEVIGDRSFGSDPGLVAKLSWQYACGLKEAGVTPCFKHFPGQGSVSGDTHEGAVANSSTLEQLYAADLIPFQNAADNEADMIMASHISYPEITGDDMPASLSYRMLTEILRGEMGFKGVIITDSFEMGAVTQKFPDPGEAAVNAVKAGADIILMPSDFHEAYNRLLSAVSSGDIEEGRIDDSLRRILKVKLGK